MSDTRKFDDGGPAFPQPLSMVGDRPCWPDDYGNGGIRLRDYFAAKAMQGLLSSHQYAEKPHEDIAKWSYEQADAMLLAAAAPSHKEKQA